MVYELIPQNGDSIAVPQLVFSNLSRADENCIRVALYVLHTGCTDPRTIAHDLGLKSIPAADRALQWWAGAGLLRKERGTAAPEQPAPEAVPDLAAVLRDPKIAVLMEHAQTYLGGSLSDSESRRLVELYTHNGYPVDVILLCISYLAGRPQGASFAAIRSELARWRRNGVTSGEEAERYLAQLDQRVKYEADTAALLGLPAADFTPGERRSIWRWRENWSFSEAMIAEGLHYLPGEKTVWALNDLLKGWHRKGWGTLADVRGGTVYGSNVRADAPAPTLPGAAQPKNNLTRNLGRPLKLKQEG